MFLIKDVVKISSKFTVENPCWSVISIKLQNNFIEITFQHGCSPVNLLHISRTPFPRNTTGWLLLLAIWSDVARDTWDMHCWYPQFLCNAEVTYVTNYFHTGGRFFITHIIESANNCHIIAHNAYAWVMFVKQYVQLQYRCPLIYHINVVCFSFIPRISPCVYSVCDAPP